MSKLWVVLGLAAIFTLGGCQKTIPFEYDESEWSSRVNQFMEKQVGATDLGRDNYHCANKLYGLDQKYIYAWVFCSGFTQPVEGKLTPGTGFSIPTRLEYDKGVIVRYEWPVDGRYYYDSWKELFGEYFEGKEPDSEMIDKFQKEILVKTYKKTN